MAFDDFKSAQSSPSAGFEAALRELRAGRKTGHWIWYVFPQLTGLGWSPMARRYALRDLQEAVDYLRDPLLCSRLVEITRVVAGRLARGDRLEELMGGRIDALKVVSSLTLFDLAARQPGAEPVNKRPAEIPSLCAQVLAAARAQGFSPCPFTLKNAGPGGSTGLQHPTTPDQ